MKFFFKKERLLLTLIVLFAVLFALIGTILKHTAFRSSNIDAPGIAFGFLAMHDGLPAKTPVQTEPTEPTKPSTSVAAPAPKPTSTGPLVPILPKPDPKPVFQTVYESYFTDALFIGDSRTDGLRLFAPFEGADYFCTTGMSVLKCLDISVEMDGIGTVTLAQLLEQKDYGKIYISLGINDVGYDHDYLADYFAALYDFVREQEPDAIVYIMASMHVAKNRARNEPMFESENVDHLNDIFGSYADEVNSFYIDENEIFDDDEGYLISDYTGDNVHLYAKYYADWDEWLCRNAVVRPGMANPGDVPPEPDEPDTPDEETNPDAQTGENE